MFISFFIPLFSHYTLFTQDLKLYDALHSYLNDEFDVWKGLMYGKARQYISAYRFTVLHECGVTRYMQRIQDQICRVLYDRLVS